MLGGLGYTGFGLVQALALMRICCGMERYGLVGVLPLGNVHMQNANLILCSKTDPISQSAF